LSVDVAVSVVAYDHSSQEIAGLLRSLSQSRLSVHTTVVDNSRTPSLRSTVEAAGAEYVHTQRNIGFGAAHNIAIRRTLGGATYHAVINPDISFGGDVLGDLYDFMELHPEVGQSMPSVRNVDGTEQRLTKRLPTPFDLILRRFLGKYGERLNPQRWARYETRDLDISVAREIPCLSGCFMFLRSATLKQVGFFDERYFLYMEDVDLCRRIGSIGKTVIVPEAVVTHGYHKGSYKRLRLLGHHLRSAIHYFNKWGWFMDSDRERRNRQCSVVIRGTDIVPPYAEISDTEAT
jgi:GT2 family glycosyltransferase